MNPAMIYGLLSEGCGIYMLEEKIALMPGDRMVRARSLYPLSTEEGVPDNDRNYESPKPK